MDAVWYVLKGEAQEGPYTDNEMISFFRKKSLNHEDLVFKGGMVDFAPFHETILYQNLKKVSEKNAREFLELPPLPPLPFEQEIVTSKAPSSELPPPPPPIVETEDVETNEVVNEIKENQTEQRVWGTHLYLPLALVVIIVAAIVFYFYTNRMDEVVKNHLSKFTQSMQTQLSKAFNPESADNFALALNSNGEAIVLGAAMSGKGVAKISLESIPGKVLSTRPVKLFAEAILENYFANFDKIELKEGDAIVSGYYKATLTIEFINRPILSFLSEKMDDKIVKESTIFLSTLSESTFDVKLNDFFKADRERRKAPLALLLEKFRTVRSIIERGELALIPKFGKFKTGKDSKDYESTYLLYINPLLQEFVQESDSIDLSYGTDNSTFIEANNAFLNLGKDILKFHSEMISEIKGMKTIKSDDQKRLKDKFLIANNHLKESYDEEILKLQKIIAEEFSN